jgi:hypothetical protein
MIIHSDSTSAIARSKHSGSGPGQQTALAIQKIISPLAAQSRSTQILWVKGHSDVPGNERADALAGKEAGKAVSSPVVSLTFSKTRIAERYNRAKKLWSDNPDHRGKDANNPPPEEVVLGRGEERLCEGCCTNTRRSLEVGGVFKAYPEAGR